MRQLWLLSVAVLAVLALAGCQLPGSIPSGWTWVTTMPDPSARVAVVGDSLTWQAEHGSSSTTDPYYLRHHLIDQLNAQGWAGRVAEQWLGSAWRGSAGRGAAAVARRGWARQGAARQGAARQGAARQSAARQGAARQQWRGGAGHGRARLGAAGI